MKKQLQKQKNNLLLFGLFFFTFIGFSQTATQTFTANGTFTVPAGVTSVTIEAWGGGGGASNAATPAGAGGGGAYTRGTLTVTPGPLTITVGTGGGIGVSGGNSSVSTIVANGGTNGSNRTGGNGGTASTITGAVTASFAGGRGGDARALTTGGSNEAGGSGGGSATRTANGNPGVNATSGTQTTGANGFTLKGGDGAAANNTPAAGNATGIGNGGGGRGEVLGTSGTGSAGQVIVTWTVGDIAITSATTRNTIPNGDATPTILKGNNFGNVNTYLNETSTSELSIYNVGSGPLNISSINISGTNSGDFVVTTNPSFNLAGGTISNFIITFNPSGTGTRTALVTINSNDPEIPAYTFNVSGFGTSPEINIQNGFNTTNILDNDNTPTNEGTEGTDFGNQYATNGAITRTYIIQNLNTANGPLTLGAITMTGDYTATAPLLTTVPVGGSTTFTITFDPTTTGTRTGTFSIVTNDTDENPYNFSLTGVGINLISNPLGIAEIDIQGGSPLSSIALYENPTTAKGTDFGNMNVVSGTVTKSFTIFNTGSLISLTSVAFNSTNAEFTVSGLATTILPGGSDTFDIIFNPNNAGTRTATINISSTGDSNEPNYRFNVTGFGTNPEIEAQIGSLTIFNDNAGASTANGTDFGNQSTSGYVNRTITIRNTGNGPMVLGAATITGNTGDYAVTYTPTTVAALSTTTLTVRFNPTTTGGRTLQFSIPVQDETDETTFRINFTGNGTAATQEINVKGGTPQIDISVYDIPTVSEGTDFGSVYFLKGTITKRFTIFNTVNTGGANLTSGGNITITGAGASDFTFTPLNQGTIAAQGSVNLDITFDPSVIGSRNAVVTILSNDPNEASYVFNITGTGITYPDSDGDGVYDNIDGDNDNDGIIDTLEQTNCILSPISGTATLVYLNETFGTGTTRGYVNDIYPATTGYTHVSAQANIQNLYDGFYCTYYKVGGLQTDPTNLSEFAWYAWAETFDHTVGDTNGKMGVFNGDSKAGLAFYEITIDGIVPNQPVNFDFYALNLDRSNQYFIDASHAAEQPRLFPNIRVEFLDTSNIVKYTYTTGNVPRCLSGTSCLNSEWIPYTCSFDLGSLTSFKLRLSNLGPGGNGNDLAIDDLVVRQTYCDNDKDGFPDIVDLDADDDGIPDITEAGYAYNGQNNAETFSLSTFNMFDLAGDNKWKDANLNGINDDIDLEITNSTYLTNHVLDADGDGVPNYLDLDSDNDGIFDVDEANPDTFYLAGGTKVANNGDGDVNGDGSGDGNDTDDDGILDVYDDYVGFGSVTKRLVTNSDGTTPADYLDVTSDGTNFDIRKTIYSSLDTDNDGRINFAALDTSDRDGLVAEFDTYDALNRGLGAPRDITGSYLIDFDGRNDYGSGKVILSSATNASLMGWIKLDNYMPAADAIIFGNDKFYIGINSSYQLYVNAKSTVTTFTSTILDKNRWYNIAATYDGSGTNGNLRLYLNGAQVQISTTAGLAGNLGSTTIPFTLAKSPTALSSYFKGFIDEVRAFNTTLSADQIQKMMCQEIKVNGTAIQGEILPKDIESTTWASLVGYFRMSDYKNDVIDDRITTSIDDSKTDINFMRIYNVKYIKPQTAPMPYVTTTNGVLATAIGTVDFSTSKFINGNDVLSTGTTPSSGTILQIKHNVNSTINRSDVGLIVDSGKTYTVTAPSPTQITGTSLTNTWYLDLQGTIDLVGRSQLIQGQESDLSLSTTGKIERDQQGTKSGYNYNYWCSPVSTISNTAVNNGYTVNGVLRDGTDANNPLAINFIPDADGQPTTPITISDYWIYRFQNVSDSYANWSYAGPTGAFNTGNGFTMKGPNVTSSSQNFTFSGKPNNASTNNGAITFPISLNNLNLSGNPFPSALDSFEFINDNIPIGGNAGSSGAITGDLYLWQHADENNSHVLANYKGGYGRLSKTGGVATVIATGGLIGGAPASARTPGRYIPVGQGFFVKGSTTGGLIKFKNSQRAFFKEENASSNTMYRQNNSNTSSDENQNQTLDQNFIKVRLGYTSVDNFYRQILLGFMNEYATNGFDYGYDAINYDDNPSDMYFINGENNYVIQGVGSFSIDSIFPLGVKSDANGTVKFKLDNTEFLQESQPVFIYDAQNNSYHNIKTADYDATVEVGTVTDRFSLRFNDGTLNTNNLNVDNGIFVSYSNNNNYINVYNNLKDTTVESVTLFNIIGQQINSWDTKAKTQNNIQIPVSQLSAGTYIVKVKTTNGTVSKKIIIK